MDSPVITHSQGRAEDFKIGMSPTLSTPHFDFMVWRLGLGVALGNLGVALTKFQGGCVLTCSKAGSYGLSRIQHFMHLI